MKVCAAAVIFLAGAETINAFGTNHILARPRALRAELDGQESFQNADDKDNADPILKAGDVPDPTKSVLGVEGDVISFDNKADLENSPFTSDNFDETGRGITEGGRAKSTERFANPISSVFRSKNSDDSVTGSEFLAVTDASVQTQSFANPTDRREDTTAPSKVSAAKYKSILGELPLGTGLLPSHQDALVGASSGSTSSFANPSDEARSQRQQGAPTPAFSRRTNVSAFGSAGAGLASHQDALVGASSGSTSSFSNPNDTARVALQQDSPTEFLAVTDASVQTQSFANPTDRREDTAAPSNVSSAKYKSILGELPLGRGGLPSHQDTLTGASSGSTSSFANPSDEIRVQRQQGAPPPAPFSDKSVSVSAFGSAGAGLASHQDALVGASSGSTSSFSNPTDAARVTLQQGSPTEFLAVTDASVQTQSFANPTDRREDTTAPSNVSAAKYKSILGELPLGSHQDTLVGPSSGSTSSFANPDDEVRVQRQQGAPTPDAFGGAFKSTNSGSKAEEAVVIGSNQDFLSDAVADPSVITQDFANPDKARIQHEQDIAPSPPTPAYNVGGNGGLPSHQDALVGASSGSLQNFANPTDSPQVRRQQVAPPVSSTTSSVFRSAQRETQVEGTGTIGSHQDASLDSASNLPTQDFANPSSDFFFKAQTSLKAGRQEASGGNQQDALANGAVPPNNAAAPEPAKVVSVNDDVVAIVNEGLAALALVNKVSNEEEAHDYRHLALKIVRDKLDELQKFEGVISDDELNKLKSALFAALPPAPPEVE